MAGNLGTLVKWTLKISAAIFIALVGLSAVAWCVWAVHENATKREAQKYEVVKDWRVDLKQYLQMDLSARTKLVDGRFRMTLDLDGYPEYLSDSRLQTKNQNAYLVVLFEDGDGFKVYEKALKISEFSTTVDGKGRKTGLNHQVDEHLSVSDYKLFSKMTVRWTLDTEIPSAPKWESAPLTENRLPDPCAPGLNKAERLRRLAKHGSVRQTGQDTYTAGNRHVTFFSAYLGGELLSCR